jgi:hypothetical protein
LVVAAKRDVEISDDAPQIVAETTVAGERGAAMRRGVSRLAGFVPTALARHCSGLFTSWSRSAAATTDDPGAPVLAAKAVKSVKRGRALSYLRNNASASCAKTPPVISIETKGAARASDSLVAMIWPMRVASSAIEAA